MNEAIRKQIINLIWRGYGSLAIVEEFSPTGDRAERELSDAIGTIRTQIEDLVRDLRGGIVESALRGGFTTSQVLDTIKEHGQDLIPLFDLQCLIAGVQAKIDAEKQKEQDEVERVEAEARKLAIQKQIDDAKAALRASGAQI